MSQHKYLLDLFTETDLVGGKSCDTLMVPNVKLNVEDGKMFADIKQYRWIVELGSFCNNLPRYYFFSECSESIYLISLDISLGFCLLYLERSPRRGILYNNYGHNKVEA